MVTKPRLHSSPLEDDLFPACHAAQSHTALVKSFTFLALPFQTLSMFSMSSQEVSPQSLSTPQELAQTFSRSWPLLGTPLWIPDLKLYIKNTSMSKRGCRCAIYFPEEVVQKAALGWLQHTVRKMWNSDYENMWTLQFFHQRQKLLTVQPKNITSGTTRHKPTVTIYNICEKIHFSDMLHVNL